MLERVARAICEQAWHDSRGFVADRRYIDDQWMRFIAQAEAAIDAMRNDDAAIKLRQDNRAVWDDLLFRP